MKEASNKFIEISSLPTSKALPRELIANAVKNLPANLVQKDKQGNVEVAGTLAASYNRVLETDFSKMFWHLDNSQHMTDTVHWCALGGSFLADFAVDTTKPRVFGWGLNPVKEALYFALKELKGRDADEIPTSACTPAEHIINFIETGQRKISQEQIVHYLSLGPAGIICLANEQAPSHFVHDSKIQFIVAGINSPFMNLVRTFMKLTGHALIGITSANFSSKGKYRLRSQGTHINLDDLQKNMGFLGIPILAGAIRTEETVSSSTSLKELYRRLHNPYLEFTEQEKEVTLDLLPTSVTVVEPSTQVDTWKVVRHGSIHYSIVSEHMKRYGIHIQLETDKRENIGTY